MQLRSIHYNMCCIAFRSGMLVAAYLQSLHPDSKPIVVPIEELDSVATMIDEQEQTTLPNVLSEVFGDDSKETIKAFAHIDRLGVQEDTN